VRKVALARQHRSQFGQDLGREQRRSVRNQWVGQIDVARTPERIQSSSLAGVTKGLVPRW
jgi:hypothetical protein